ncbi:hypothetical protein NK718_13770 [Alsobacter sp. SYSU M60028]|uniref:Uncharacterized protein n=1 Tax=Alsobacter ponti TaxID=2962936 RepID=A0ABT1LFT6_9HYPH|nr:hypothetical protein [Alsobacter ponti]MCP8939590.1 hypothetical protein [Alsobacter ponti]
MSAIQRAVRLVLAAALALPPLAAMAQQKDMGVNVAGRSKPTLCAEDDNVYLTFSNPRVRYFKLEARPPAVIGSIAQDSRAPDFTDCTIKDQPPGPEDKVERLVLYEDDELMLVGYRHSEFWRKGDVPVTVGDRMERALHLVQLFAKTPRGPYEYLVLYPLDGYWRLRPLPPARLDEIAYGTSFLVGPVEEKERPFVSLRAVRFMPKIKSFELTFAKGEAGTVRVAELGESAASVEVKLEAGTRGRPFAALRSMFVMETNADAAHVAWKEPRGKGWVSRPVMDFYGSYATEFWLGRTAPSRHNTSAPDTLLKGFAPE